MIPASKLKKMTFENGCSKCKSQNVESLCFHLYELTEADWRYISLQHGVKA